MKYEAPADGTAILVERTSGRIVATESLAEGQTFCFTPSCEGYDETLFTMFGKVSGVADSVVVAVPTNTCFQLYFVPTRTRAE